MTGCKLKYGVLSGLLLLFFFLSGMAQSLPSADTEPRAAFYKGGYGYGYARNPLVMRTLHIDVELGIDRYVFVGDRVRLTAVDERGQVIIAGLTWAMDGKVLADKSNPLEIEADSNRVITVVYQKDGYTTGTQLKIYVEPSRKVYFGGGADDGYGRSDLVIRTRPLMVQLGEDLHVLQGDALNIKALDQFGNLITDGLSWEIDGVVYGSGQNPLNLTADTNCYIKVFYSKDNNRVSDDLQVYVEPARKIHYLGGINDGYTHSPYVARINHLLVGLGEDRHVFVGDSVWVTALDDYGQIITDGLVWEKDGEMLTLTDNPLLVVADKDCDIHATYKKDGFTATDDLKIYVEPARKMHYEGGVDDGYGRGDYVFRINKLKVDLGEDRHVFIGDTVTLTALDQDGNVIIGDLVWLKNGVRFEDDLNPVRVIVDTSMLIQVEYRKDGFKAFDDLNIFAEPKRNTHHKGGIDDGYGRNSLVFRLRWPEVHLGPDLYVAAGDTVTIEALNEAGERIGSGLIWLRDSIELPAIYTNPIRFIANKTTVITAFYTVDGYTVSDRLIVNVEPPRARFYRGGGDDGYSANCLPPVIIEQRGMEVAQCMAMENAELKIVAEGRGIAYQWEKLNVLTGLFEPVVSAGVEGQQTPELKFTNLQPADNGAYRCVLTNACAEEPRYSKTFSISAGGEPTILSGINDREQCLGSGINEFHVVAGSVLVNDVFAYRWYKDGVQVSEENDTLNSVYMVPLNSETVEGFYSVTVSNACGQVSDTAFLKILKAPVIDSVSRELYACLGGSVDFWVKTREVSDYEYILYRIQKLTATDTVLQEVSRGSSKYTLDNVMEAGSYIWKVMQPYCKSVYSERMELRMNDVPVLTERPSAQTVCYGSPLMLRCRAKSSNGAPLRYTWYKNGLVYTSASERGDLYFSYATFQTAGEYECYVSTDCGQVRTGRVTVKVKDKPVILSEPEVVSEYCVGDLIRIPVQLSLMQAVDSIRWFYQGNRLTDVPSRIEGSATAVLTIDSVTPADGKGVYFVRAYNGCGYTDSRSVKFEVREPARFKRKLSDGDVHLVMCDGEEQALTVEAEGTAPLFFRWLLNGELIVDGSSNTLVVEGSRLDVTGKYTCIVYNACDDDITEAYLEISRPDTFRLTGGGRYCEGTIGVPAMLVGSETGVTYKLQNKNTGDFTHVMLPDSTTPPAPVYFTDVRNGLYYAYAIDTNNCQVKMPGEVLVVEDPQPVRFELNVVRDICPGDVGGDLLLSGSQRGVTYRLCRLRDTQWDTIRPYYAGTGNPIAFSNQPAGTYKVVAVMDATGCSSTMPVMATIAIRPLPQLCRLDYWNGDSVYCANVTSTIGLHYACGEPESRYQLLRNGVGFGSVVDQPQWNALTKGVYTVKITNRWGCSVTGGARQVYAQEPPAVHSLIGEEYFCEYDAGNRLIELAGSDAGVRYAFVYGNGLLYKDTLSSGGAIIMPVPMEERTWKVIATDTTRLRCSVEMPDRISVKLSRIALTATSPVVVDYKDSVRLTVTVSGYAGAASALVYAWDNTAFLSGSPSEPAPWTKPVTESHTFQVTVQDVSGCNAQTEVRVNCRGGDFRGEIRANDCTSSIERFELCGGDAVGLCAYVTGGADGNYTYRWWDDTGNLGRDYRISGYVKASDGYIWLEAACGNEVFRDSVWITVNETPVPESVENSGVRCIRPGEALTVTLSNSHRGTVYQLEHRKENGSYALIGTPQGGADGPLSFVVSNGVDVVGNLRVTARLQHKDGVGYCEKIMRGEIEVRRAPLVFEVRGGMDYCIGTAQDIKISIDSSERSVSYVLLLNGTRQIATSKGTNDTLAFAGRFSDGRYTITGSVNGCTTAMTGEAVVKGHALPNPGRLTGAGNYCETQVPVELAITRGERNTAYTLTIDSINGSSGQQIYCGLDRLSLGYHAALGKYTVEARDTITGCYVKLKDSVVIGAVPAVVQLEQNAYICQGDSMANVRLRLYPAAEGVVYTLYDSVWNPKGIYNNANGDTLYYTGCLKPGWYRVKASIGECTELYTQKIRVGNAAPIDPIRMVEPYGVCEGNLLAVGVDASQPGLYYTLFRQTDTLELLSGMRGNGTTLNLGSFTETGKYYIVATDMVSRCTLRGAEDYRIEARPAEFAIQGKTSYCPAEGGTTIGLTGTGKQVQYLLQRRDEVGLEWEDVPGGRLTGDGNAKSLTGRYPEGIYRIVAGEVCRLPMTGQLVVRMAEYPDKADTLRLDGNGCAAANVTLYLPSGKAGLEYTLFCDRTIVGKKTGDGSRLEWQLSNARPGVYSLQVEIDGCVLVLPGQPRIAAAPILPELKGDTVFCADAKGMLYLAAYQENVSYNLYALPADTLTALGSKNGYRWEYKDLKAGVYYVKAKSGDCVLTNGSVRLREVPRPGRPSTEGSRCVEQGQGILTLRNTLPDLSYHVEGPGVALTVVNHSGDTILSGLGTGIYKIKARDILYGCVSTEVSDTISESVYADSLVNGFTYCEGSAGLKLRLSGARMGVLYQILTPSRQVLDTVRWPQREFERYFTDGTYIFRKVREGILGGCYEEKQFEVSKQQLPEKHLPLELEGSSLACAGESYRVVLPVTEAEKRYILQSDGTDIDTLYGNGTRLSFNRTINSTGVYSVFVSDTLHYCGVTLDTTLRLLPRPSAVTIENCSYCYGFDEDPSVDSCSVSLSDMEAGICYVLTGHGVNDTLRGTGMNNFGRWHSGNYQVVAQNETTGCRDTFPAMISGFRAARAYTVLHGCDSLPALSEIRTIDGGDDSTTMYYLYRDGQRTGRYIAGNGSDVVFTGITEPGVYKIWGEKAGSGCGAFMKDSVWLFHSLEYGKMRVIGEFCENTEAGVLIDYLNAVKSWKYYITNDTLYSDTVTGGNKKVLWQQIGKRSIQNGLYKLYAINPCGDEFYVDSIRVTGKKVALRSNVVNPNVGLCAGESFTLALDSSYVGVNYTVRYYALGADTAISYPVVKGTGHPVRLGVYNTAGLYHVWADNSCVYVMDSVKVVNNTMPQVFPVSGMDKCMNGTQDSILVCLPGREQDIAYYLYVNGNVPVDSLTSSWRPNAGCFNYARTPGCYTVKGIHEINGCESMMTGSICLSTTPVVDVVENPGVLVELCQGQDTAVYIRKSETGVHYSLYLNRREKVAEVDGNGGRLKVGYASKTGTYTVQAYVGDCRTWMSDSVLVKVHPLPQFRLTENAYRYCVNGNGVQIRLDDPTFPTTLYSLYAPDSTLVESRYGSELMSGFAFDAYSVGAGAHYIIAKDTATGCEASGKIQISLEPLPEVFPLFTSNGDYLCVNGKIKIGQEGSSSSAYYELFRVGNPGVLSRANGNDSVLIFGTSVEKAGQYVVKATELNSYGCSDYSDTLRIIQADTIHEYSFVPVKNSYCGTDPEKGIVRLAGSDAGIVYELEKNRVMTGEVKAGTGGAIEWSGLEGGACGAGVIYRIIARNTVTGCEHWMPGSDTIIKQGILSTIVREPNEQQLVKCEGERVYFSISTGGCREHYIWMHDRDTVKEGNEPFYNIEATQVSDYGSYYCIISNSCESRESRPVSLEVRERVTLANPMKDIYLVGHGTHDKMLAAGFRNAVSYYWYKIGAENICLGSKPYLELLNITEADTGRYVCRGTNLCGSLEDTCSVQYAVFPKVIVTMSVDTVCRGTDFSTPTILPIQVDTLIWYRNGEFVQGGGVDYQKTAVEPGDAGVYSVYAANAFGDTLVYVATLYVDDTLRVRSISDPVMTRCAGDKVELSVNVEPSERVFYRWKLNGAIVGTNRTYNTGLLAAGVHNEYKIEYYNKCNTGEGSILIRVPDTIRYTPAPAQISVCSDPHRDTVLRLNTDPSVLATFKWYYRKKSTDVNRKQLPSTADTLSINMQVRNSGFYYCEISSVCQSRTTEATWMRVDSVPVVMGTLQDMSLCEGNSLVLSFPVTGGEVKGQLIMQRKDGSREILGENNLLDYNSVADFTYGPLTMAEDSSVLFCYLKNRCGEAWSDTMLLRVKPAPQVAVDPDLVYLMGNEAKVVVSLLEGTIPWSYHYTVNGKEEQVVSARTGQTDTLRVGKAGLYDIVWVEDAGGCIRSELLPSFVVQEPGALVAAITGGGEVCFGEETALNIKVVGGRGPWEVHIYRMSDGLLADEIPGNPLILPISVQDTTLTITATASETYYIGKFLDLNNGGTSYEGMMTNDRAVVVVLEGTPLRFTPIRDNHVGQCQPIDLYDLLKPYIPKADGTSQMLGEADGMFMVDGNELHGKWGEGNDLTAGIHTIAYKYNGAGCFLMPEVELIVDTLYGEILLPDKMCNGDKISFELDMVGRAPFNVVITREYVQYNGQHKPVTEESLTMPRNDYSSFVSFMPEDSCLIYNVKSILDVHGCAPKQSLPLADTVSRMRPVKFKIEVRNLSVPGSGWTPLPLVCDIPSGDSLGVKFTRTAGDAPWQVYISDKEEPDVFLSVLNISGQDTVITLKEARTYLLCAGNKSCGRDVTSGRRLQLRHLITGYLKMKVWLEGAYDAATSKMVSKIESELPKYGMTAFPASIRGRIIDWMPIEVRLANGATAADVAALENGAQLIARDTCLLLNDGRLVNRAGNDTLNILNCIIENADNTNDYYLVLNHRNHLPVMSADVVKFVNAANRQGVQTLDLTKSVNVYYTGRPEQHMTQVGNGIWALSTGEINDNTLITVRDVNIGNVKKQDTGYYLYDVNFDGKVGRWTEGSEDDDWLMILKNRDKFSEIKFVK